MQNQNEISTQTKLTPAETNNDDSFRQPYCKPILEELGDLRTQTLGGTAGVGDSSGGELTEFPPG